MLFASSFSGKNGLIWDVGTGCFLPRNAHVPLTTLVNSTPVEVTFVQEEISQTGGTSATGSPRTLRNICLFQRDGEKAILLFALRADPARHKAGSWAPVRCGVQVLKCACQH
jgi:hypothetical protein